MMRLRAVVLDRDERSVLRELGEWGAIELTREVPGPQTAPLPPRDRGTEIGRCDRLLGRIDSLRRALEVSTSSLPSPRSPGLSLAAVEAKVGEMEDRAAELLKQRQSRAQRCQELAALNDRVADYGAWDIPLDPRDSSSFLHFVTGNLPTKNVGKLLEGVGEGAALLPLEDEEGRCQLIAMVTRRGRPRLDRALSEAGFEPQTLPIAEGATTSSLFAESGREREQVASQLEQSNRQLREYAAEASDSLASIEQQLTVERRLLEAGQRFPRTDATVLIAGWIPAMDAASLEKKLRRITGERCVVELSVPDRPSDEEIPVLLRHPRWLRPFGALVTAYGLPQYRELEPTLFVALSYVLMFGMMFGDAGHGAVLAAGGCIAWRAGRTPRIREVGQLLLLVAMSSILFGVVYGSWFGLPQMKHHALWQDPLEGDPMGLMYAAIGIGIVMISLGLLLNIVNRFRQGDIIGGLLDKFGLIGVVFYWGALLLITKSAALQSRGLFGVALVVFLLIPLVGWALKEPIEYLLKHRGGDQGGPGEGLFSAIIEAFVGAFEGLLSYLANTISFVRLAAYAMSHAALLVAAFMMAAEVGHLSPGGGVLSVAVIILGNVIAIVLEGIVASVQALRLEYYEFFGKFFSGNGRPFEPFRLTPLAS